MTRGEDATSIRHHSDDGICSWRWCSLNTTQAVYYRAPCPARWAYPCFTCFLHTLCDQQEPFDNAPVLGAGEESIFNLLSSYRPLKAQGLILFVTSLSVESPHARQPCATKKFLLSGTTSVSFDRTYNVSIFAYVSMQRLILSKLARRGNNGD